MERNKRLLLKAAKRIEEIPQSYDQETFYRESRSSPCGAAACLGGEIIICSERSAIKGIKKLGDVIARSHRVGTGLGSKAWPGYVAARLAGLTKDEAERLFYNSEAETWPPKFKAQYQRAKSAKGRAGVASRLLRHVAEGGEV